MPILNLLPIKQAVKMGANELIESDTPELDSQLILLHCLNAHRNILFTDPDHLLSIEQQKQFIDLIQRRKQGEPVAYLIGEQGFWDLTLDVSTHTLIPRSDTESLIDWVLEQSFQPNHILDLGTGTGALALALAQEFPKASVLGVDLIEQAVELAAHNKLKNNIENARFIQSSWFENVPKQRFELIVSNPPYIDEGDEHLSQGDVQFEPKSALVANNHGFADLFYIAKQSIHYLSVGGCLLMEHGWQQAEGVQQELTRLGYENVGSGKDLAGQWRFTFGFKAK